MNDHSIFYYFFEASLLVKFVMLLLVAASVASWTFIFQRYSCLKKEKIAMDEFEDRFWSGGSLTKLYQELNQSGQEHTGLAKIFKAGFKEFMTLEKQPGMTAKAVLEGAQRAMRVAQRRTVDELEKHLTFLATVGSVSPYVGLFGTVWGIMSSFQALSGAQQATIAAVAPGISEALIATAMGLFAAIPAVIAYNRFTHTTEHMQNRIDAFQEEFSNVLYRHVQQAIETRSKEHV